MTKILSTSRGILAFAETESELEKIRKAWPVKETLHITDWASKDSKTTQRKPKRSERDA